MTRPLAARIGLALLLCAPRVVNAQSAQGLADECVASGGGQVACARSAGAGRDLAGYISVLAAPGAELPGQASTLGMRLGGSPRFAVSLRASAISVVFPELSDAGGTLEGSSVVPAIGAVVAAGLFEGFNVLPTVGGVLSFDVIGSANLLFFPIEEGFAGSADVLAIGGRVGILRESFTLPAVTVAASRGFGGGLRLSSSTGPLPRVEIDPSITSLRVTVGKDLYSFGVMAGVGWDHFSSLTTVRVPFGAGVGSARDTLEDTRRTYFGGLSKQLGVISWISAGVGWVHGFDAVTAGTAASPGTGRQIYGSVSLLLRL